MTSPVRADFQVVGHRGARGLYPENTLEGFLAARNAGVRRFEVDIAVTADDVPVLYHDLVLNPDITRGPEGMWLARSGPPIGSVTLAELAAYDVGRIRLGSGYAARFPVQEAIDSARIPTLSAVLEALPEADFTIELKTDPSQSEVTISGPRMAELVVGVAEAAGALRRIRVQSFDWSGPRHLGRIRPDIARAWLTEPKTVADAKIWWGVERKGRSVPEMIVAEGGDVWAPEWESLVEADVKEAERLGIRVIPWTVNEPEAIGRLAKWGVAGVITDRPDVAMKEIGQVGHDGGGDDLSRLRDN